MKYLTSVAFELRLKIEHVVTMLNATKVLKYLSKIDVESILALFYAKMVNLNVFQCID